jgi:hypothetical protein
MTSVGFLLQLSPASSVPLAAKLSIFKLQIDFLPVVGRKEYLKVPSPFPFPKSHNLENNIMFLFFLSSKPK